MLTYKLPLIVILAPSKLYSEWQIGVGESKYGDPLFIGREGDPLHISGTVQARNLKFGTQMDPVRYKRKK